MKRVRFIIEADVPDAYGDNELGNLLFTAAVQIVEPIIGYTEEGSDEIKGVTDNVDSRLEVLEADDDDESAAYFTVISNPAVPTNDAIKAYLYSHSEIQPTSAVDSAGRHHYLIKTVANDQGEARRLAQYQADRLSSGLYGVSDVDTDLDLVVTCHEQSWGVDLTPDPIFSDH